MSEIEAFLAAFGAPAGLGVWVVWQWLRQVRSGDGGTTMTGKLDAIQHDLSDLRERLAKLEGYLDGQKG